MIGPFLPGGGIRGGLPLDSHDLGCLRSFSGWEWNTAARLCYETGP